MITCMVTRRLGQGRKSQGPRLVVPETPSPTLSDFQNYSPDGRVLSNRRWSSIYEGHGRDRAFPEQPGMFSLQGITVDGRPTLLDDEELKVKSVESVQRSIRSEKMLSKHFIAPNARSNRRASLHGCDFRATLASTAVESDAVLHPKEVLYLQKIALASNEEARRKNLTNEMAHISLDGRIMNAVSATCSSRIGGDLGEEEAQAWDCFAPLQRVLIVAVAAAAAAATKQKNHKEINRLQRAVNAQENALSLMRRELSNLWDQVATEENGPLSFTTPKQLQIDQRATSASPATPGIRRDAPNPETPVRGTPRTYKKQPNSELPDGASGSCDQYNDDPINKGVLLIESPKDQLQTVHSSGAAKWYSNPLIEHNAPQSEDSGQSEHYFEDCTPEKRRRIFSRFTIDSREPVEWTSVKCSFTTITADAATPLTSRKRFSFEDSRGQSKERSPDSQETAAMRARCATVLIEVKNQVLSVLDKEASCVMAALSHVIEKAQKLEKMDRTASKLSRRLNTPEKIAQASAALKESVEKASAQVASLQAAVVSIWHTIGPQALASLNLSPVELEKYLLRVTKDSLMNSDTKPTVSSEEGFLEWKQWLETKHNEAPVPSLLSRIEEASDTSPKEEKQALCSPRWRQKGSEVASAIGVAVRRTVDSLMAPLDGRRAEENFRSPVAKQRVSALSEDAPQFLAQHLLGELEKAAAKIAGMESQMLTLKQSVRESDAKREKAELKLAEAIARDHQNQEKFEREMNELTKKLREKESAYDELLRSRKVMFLVKSKEIAELKKDCQRRDAALDDITAAAQATRDASDERLAVLEDICKRKNSAIHELKREIIALEDQVHELKLRSPFLLPGEGRRKLALIPSSTDEVLALEDTFNGVCQETNPNQASSPSHELALLPSSLNDTSDQPQSISIFMPTRDYCVGDNIFQESQAHNRGVTPSPGDLSLPCISAENFTRLRASTSSLPNTARESLSLRRQLACSIDGSIFPSPSSTIFDDFLEVESSLQALAADERSQLSNDFCTPSNDDSLRCSQEYFSAKGKPGSELKQLNNMTAGSCPESAGSNTKISNLPPARGNVTFTSADENTKPRGVLRPTKASSLKAQGKAKAIKKENDTESHEEEEINWVNAGILASLELNGSLNGSVNSRRTSNSSTHLKETTGKSKENNNTKRRRWH